MVLDATLLGTQLYKVSKMEQSMEWIWKGGLRIALYCDRQLYFLLT